MEAVHWAFARAGADILTAASYQATMPGLAAHQYAHESMSPPSATGGERTGLGRMAYTWQMGPNTRAGTTQNRTGSGISLCGRGKSFWTRMQIAWRVHPFPVCMKGEVRANILAEIPGMAAWVWFTCPVSCACVLREPGKGLC